MQDAANDKSMCYGRLVFRVLGDICLVGRDGYEAAAEQYRQTHSGTSAHYFRKWYTGQILSKHTLPESFIRIVDETVETLPERYKQLVQYRFGLIDGNEHTRREAGQKIDNMQTGRKAVSSVRAGRMEVDALRMLRESARIKKIQAGLNEELQTLFNFYLTD